MKKNKYINILDLIENINNKGFIECSNIEGDNKEEYESILFYLNFCKSWFIGQNMEEIKEDEINGKRNNVYDNIK